MSAATPQPATSARPVANAPAGAWLAPALRRLAGDAIFRWALLLSCGVALPYALLLAGREVPRSYRDGWSFVYLGIVSAIVLVAGGRAASAEVERRLHFGLAWAFGFWALEEALETAFWDGGAGAFSIGLDALFVAVYGALLLATDDSRRWRPETGSFGLRRLERLQLAVFLGGLLLYFTVVPARLDPAGYLTEAPSSLGYLWSDVLLLVWFLWRGRRARQPRELARWRLLQVSSVLFAVGDACYLAAIAGALDLSPHWIDFVWYPPFLTAVAAARVGPLGDAGRDAPETSREPELPVPDLNLGWTLAALMPASHLLSESFGALPDPSAGSRRWVVAATSAALLALAALQQRRIWALERRVRDAAEVVRAREATSSRLEAIGVLAGGVAHDFRRLVDEMRGRAAVLAAAGLDEPSRRDLDAVTRAIERAAGLTQELLAVGQLERPRRRELDLVPWIAELVPALADLCGERVELVLETSERELRCAADAAQLERVAANLVLNAREAMPGGGKLEIGLRRRRLDRQPGSAAPSAGAEVAAFSFRDHGGGMSRETRARIFEPFFTTKTERAGHGLGLSTALGLVRAHGGDIVVESAPGAGSTFEVLLPLDAAGGAGGAAAPR